LVLTFLVLPFWYLLTRVDPDIFQTSSKTVVCIFRFVDAAVMHICFCYVRYSSFVCNQLVGIEKFVCKIMATAVPVEQLSIVILFSPHSMPQKPAW